MTANSQRWLLAIGLLCFVLGAAALYVNKPPNPDQAIFDYIGWIGGEGGRYYVDVAEQNFPGEMFLHEVAFRIFGVHLWAYRALDFGVLLTGAAALAGLLRTAGFGVGAVAGTLTYLVGYVSSNAWMSGQRDVVAANLLLLVGYLFVGRLRGGGLPTLFALGPILFLALLIRPTYVLFAAGLPLLDWWMARRTSRPPVKRLVDVGLVVAMMLACVAMLLVWGWLRGSFAAFREQALLFNTQAYSAGHSRWDTIVKLVGVLGSYLWFVPAAVIGVARGSKREDARAPLGVLLILVGMGLVSAFLQNKGFGYHLGAMLPPLYGLAGAGCWELLQDIRTDRRSRKSLVDPAGIAAVTLALLGLAYQVKSLGPQIRYVTGLNTYRQMMARESAGSANLLWADLLDAAEYVSATTTPADTILVWGRPVSLHLLAQRKSASRFITAGMLVLAKPPFEGAERWNREFETMLATKPPKLVFLPAVGDAVEYGAFVPEDNDRGPIATLRQAVADKYEPVRDFGSLRAYRLRER